MSVEDRSPVVMENPEGAGQFVIDDENILERDTDLIVLRRKVIEHSK